MLDKMLVVERLARWLSGRWNQTRAHVGCAEVMTKPCSSPRVLID